MKSLGHVIFLKCHIQSKCLDRTWERDVICILEGVQKRYIKWYLLVPSMEMKEHSRRVNSM